MRCDAKVEVMLGTMVWTAVLAVFLSIVPFSTAAPRRSRKVMMKSNVWA